MDDESNSDEEAGRGRGRMGSMSSNRDRMRAERRLIARELEYTRRMYCRPGQGGKGRKRRRSWGEIIVDDSSENDEGEDVGIMVPAIEAAEVDNTRRNAHAARLAVRLAMDAVVRTCTSM
jgi:hypothetical protein